MPTINAFSANPSLGGNTTISTTAANITDFGLVRLIKTPRTKCDRITVNDQMRWEPLWTPRWAIFAGQYLGGRLRGGGLKRTKRGRRPVSRDATPNTSNRVRRRSLPHYRPMETAEKHPLTPPVPPASRKRRQRLDPPLGPDQLIFRSSPPCAVRAKKQVRGFKRN